MKKPDDEKDRFSLPITIKKERLEMIEGFYKGSKGYEIQDLVGSTVRSKIPDIGTSEPPKKKIEREPLNIDELTSGISEDIEQLRQSGFQIREASLKDAEQICERDIYQIYPYISLLSGRYKDSMRIIIIEYQGVPCGFSIFGNFEEEGEVLGEVGMLHISPEARGMGLMKILGILSRKVMVDSSDKLYSAVADESGAIIRFLTKLGHKDSGKLTSGAGRYPIWLMDLSEIDKSEYKSTLDGFFHQESERIVQNKKKSIDVDKLDKDNPLRDSTNVTSSTMDRFNSLGFYPEEELIYYFGYWHSLISIRKVPPNDYNRIPRLILSVKKEFLLDRDLSSYVDSSKEGGLENATESDDYSTIECNFSFSDIQDGKHKLELLAGIANKIIEYKRAS